jgi:hypothetical protein
MQHSALAAIFQHEYREYRDAQGAPDRDGEKARHTSTIVAVSSQADTRLSSIGVKCSTKALGAVHYAWDVQRDVMRFF